MLAKTGKADIDAGTTLTVSDDGTVKATAGAVEMTAQNAVTVTGTAVVEAGTSVTVESKAAGDVTIDTTGSVTANDGNVTIDNDNGAVTVQKGTVEAKSAPVVPPAVATVANVDIDATGDVKIDTGATVKANDNVTVDTTAGNVSAKDATVEAGNNMLVKADVGNVTIDTGSTVTADKNLTVEAGNDVNIKTTTASVEAKTGDAYVEAKNGDITMDAGTKVKAGHNAYLGADTGELKVANVEAGQAAWLVAGGDIVNNDISGVQVKAKELRLDAGGSVGADGTPFKTDVNNIEATAALGNVVIDEKDDITIGNVGSDDPAGKLYVNKVTADGSLATPPPSAPDMAGIDSDGDAKLTANGSITVAEDVAAENAAALTASSGDVTVNASVSGNDTDINASGDVTVNGSVSGSSTTDVNAGGTVTVNGSVTGGNTGINAGGNVNVNGIISGGGMSITAGGDIAFDEDGQVSGNTVTMTFGGDLTQEGATVTANRGYISGKTDLHAAIKTEDITLESTGGSIGKAGANSSSYIVVGSDSGTVKVTATADGDVAIAAADANTIDVAEITAGKSASVFTAGTIKPTGKIKAGKDISVSAKNFMGGIVKISLGGRLTVNNFGDAMFGNPLLAIFSTSGGNRNVNVNNQPNKSVVFVDGRLAGGDLQTINKLGAMEAFPVQTPELKSEQGVFGNPIFLHDELGVANPLAVGAIDFLLLDIPRLTLSSDFPLEIEKQVAAAGLNPTTSYWFGQKPADADKSNDSEKKENDSNGEGGSSEGKGSGEASSDGSNQTAMN